LPPCEWIAYRCSGAVLWHLGDEGGRHGGRAVRDPAKLALERGLAAVGLVCVTRTEHIPPGKLPTPHIDHICVPEAWAQRGKVVEAWPGTVEGVRLSDHSAVVVEVSPGE
jgi:hypothetical protein